MNGPDGGFIDWAMPKGDDGRPHFAAPMMGAGADRTRCKVCGHRIYRASGPGMGRAYRHVKADR